MPRGKRKGRKPTFVMEDDLGGVRVNRTTHRHTAEIHGEGEIRNLRPWAKRRVLEQAGVGRRRIRQLVEPELFG